MRLHGILATDLQAVLAHPTKTDVDPNGNPRISGLDNRRRAIIVVVAGDDPEFVITTFPDDRYAL